MIIYVVRHTQVAVGKDTCYGQSNPPLADTFAAEAAHLYATLPNNFEIVFSSPLLRCVALAEALVQSNNTAHRLSLSDIHVKSELMEMDFGDWEGQKWNDLNQEDLNAWMQDFVYMQVPNGENLVAVAERVNRFLDDLRQAQHQKVLIVTHAGVIRCISAYFLQIPLQDIFKTSVQYGDVFIFDTRLNSCQVLR